MGTVNLYEAKGQLSALVEKASHGEETVICKAGKPMAKLVPIEPVAEQGQGRARFFGKNLLGITYISPDFDEPAWSDEELKEFGFL